MDCWIVQIRTDIYILGMSSEPGLHLTSHYTSWEVAHTEATAREASAAAAPFLHHCCFSFQKTKGLGEGFSFPFLTICGSDPQQVTRGVFARIV